MAQSLPYQTILLRGALVSIDQTGTGTKRTIPFQYNPSQLTRNLSPRSYQQGKDDSQRLTDTPKQTISLDIQLEATFTNFLGSDLIPPTPLVGLLPQLAALELLLSPSSDQLTTYQEKLESGTLAAVPPVPPRILFVWGPGRVLPVSITSMNVTEEIFDGLLVPIRAKVKISLEVNSFFGASTTKDREYLLTHVQKQELLATIARLPGVLGTAATGVLVD